ncbi:MAG TPA: tetratricopeptide repeat protein [Verrucomicrobiae bacterium]|nr:tetratricopeptide repeat protein [Verrucomicrobiae bacterium]
MNQLLRLILRGVVIVGIAVTSAFLITSYLRQTDWFKEQMYRRLVNGAAEKKLHAASVLADVGGEEQLLRALKSEDPATSEAARRAVEYVWFNAAGREAFERMQAAYHAEEQEDYAQAIKILDELVAKFPRFAEAWNRRGSVHWQLGQYDQSMADCRRALKLNPHHYGALQGQGVCFLKKGDLLEACKALRAALKIAPHDEATRRTLRKCEELLRACPPAGQPRQSSDLI